MWPTVDQAYSYHRSQKYAVFFSLLYNADIHVSSALLDNITDNISSISLYCTSQGNHIQCVRNLAFS